MVAEGIVIVETIVEISGTIFIISWKIRDWRKKIKQNEKKINRISEEMLDITEKTRGNLEDVLYDLIRELNRYFDKDEYDCDELQEKFEKLTYQIFEDVENKMGEMIMIFKEDKDFLEEQMPVDIFKFFNKLSRSLDEKKKSLELNGFIEISSEYNALLEFSQNEPEKIKSEIPIRKLENLVRKMQQKPLKVPCVYHINHKIMKNNFENKKLVLNYSKKILRTSFNPD